jgi:hypothetical protein
MAKKGHSEEQILRPLRRARFCESPRNASCEQNQTDFSAIEPAPLLQSRLRSDSTPRASTR